MSSFIAPSRPSKRSKPLELSSNTEAPLFPRIEVDDDAASDSLLFPIFRKKQRKTISSTGAVAGLLGYGAPGRMVEEREQRSTSLEATSKLFAVAGESDPKTGDDNYDAIVEDPSVEGVGDCDIGDFDEDDEYIPGPDGEDGENIAAFDVLGNSHQNTDPVIVDSGDDCVMEFRRRLRVILTRLKEEVLALPPLLAGLTRAEKPMTPGYWILLSRVDIDFLMGLYLKGIPIKTQAILGRSIWTTEDFLSLPTRGIESKAAGVYVDLPSSSDTGVTESYVGSSKELQKRIGIHKTNGRMTPEKLGKSSEKNSCHYQFICQKGVVTDFRCLAVFDKTSIAGGYVLLLEAVMMIVLDTYQPSSAGYHRHASKASYDLVKKLRASVDFPPVSWKGLNRAWPCFQGFPNYGSKSITPCANPVCIFDTYPKALAPVGQKSKRMLAVQGDPLSGGYYCSYCSSHLRDPVGSLPTAAKIQSVAKYRNARALHTTADRACDGCRRLESQMSAQKGYMKAFQPLEAYPGKYFCPSCMERHTRYKKPLDDDVDERSRTNIGRANLRAAVKNGTEIICGNCSMICSDASYTNKRKAVYNAQTQMILCGVCACYLTFHKKLPDGPKKQ